uniref:Uncharacterized protein n=1 Tax=Rhizophora mucronata TaxID=61149 RepID=A0A2P2Q223_RHIMU
MKDCAELPSYRNAKRGNHMLTHTCKTEHLILTVSLLSAF